MFLIGSASSFFQRSACASVSEQKSPSASTPAMRNVPTIRSPPSLRLGRRPFSFPSSSQIRTAPSFSPAHSMYPPTLFWNASSRFSIWSSRTGPPGSARRTRILPRFSSRGQHSGRNPTRSISPSKYADATSACRASLSQKSSASILFSCSPAPNAASSSAREHVHFPVSVCMHSRRTASLAAVSHLRNVRSSSGVTSVISRPPGM